MGGKVIEDRHNVEQDNTIYLEGLRRGAKRVKEAKVNNKVNPSKRRKISDEVTYRDGGATYKQQKRKRQLVEEDICDEHRTKSPRKDKVCREEIKESVDFSNSINNTNIGFNIDETNTRAEQKQHSTKQLPISIFLKKVDTSSDSISQANNPGPKERGGQFKNFPSKTDDQKSLPTAKNSEKVSRGKSHQKQAEAKLSLSSTNRDSNPTQPKPKYPRKRKNTAGGLPNSTKFPFKFKPMQDHFKSLGTKTTPTESKAETKEGQPKSAKTSPSKVTEEP